MASRIDRETVVPLEVVAILFSIGISTTIAGAFWVKGVNDHLELIDKRFSRVETKLGIADSATRQPAQSTSIDFIPRAEAKGVAYGLASKEK